jgi:Ribbon-helix-helix protein, copG family
MKTTLVISDRVLAKLRQEAARRHCTISELVEAALRQFLDRREAPGSIPPLPSFDSGGALVDVADRDALYQAMEGR